jgi:hypothetical protein
MDDRTNVDEVESSIFVYFGLFLSEYVNSKATLHLGDLQTTNFITYKPFTLLAYGVKTRSAY